MKMRRREEKEKEKRRGRKKKGGEEKEEEEQRYREPTEALIDKIPLAAISEITVSRIISTLEVLKDVSG